MFPIFTPLESIALYVEESRRRTRSNHGTMPKTHYSDLCRGVEKGKEARESSTPGRL